jgi:hypothetical protein
MESIDSGKIRKMILQRQDLCFQPLQAKKPPEAMAEEKIKDILRRMKGWRKSMKYWQFLCSCASSMLSEEERREPAD